MAYQASRSALWPVARWWPATGIAAEPTTCAIFDKLSLQAAISECPEISFVINRRLALRVERLVTRLDERLRSVRCRLAEFFIDRLDESNMGNRVSIGMTQLALAEELGTVREVVSREIRALVKDGTITRLEGGRYAIENRDSLQRIAEGEL